ncbi:MAG TPA: hypothetical protein VMZ25_10585, partial [Terriglobales bacterium]|nr:hypothetical protein [Terriglobales bacterium]
MAGIWNLDGEPVSREILASMSARMAHRGPDGETFWIQGEAGFAYQMMKVQPESASERQPLEHPAGITLVYDGRLDNREELLQKLPHSAGVSSASPDPEIVMAMYREWGEGFAQHLVGDIALAIWDGSKRRMLLARDVMAGRTLYHCRFGNTFLFATEIKTLLAHPLVNTAPNDWAL